MSAAISFDAPFAALDRAATEACLFSRVIGLLRLAEHQQPSLRSRATAEAEALWQSVLVAMANNSAGLPDGLRRDITLVGRAVLKDLKSGRPDFGFIREVSENIMGGLAGRMN